MRDTWKTRITQSGRHEASEEIDKEDEGEKERPVNDKEKQQYEALGWSAVSPHWSELV